MNERRWYPIGEEAHEMKKHMQVALVAVGLGFAAMGCRNNRTEERRSQETQTTGADVQKQQEDYRKTKADHDQDRDKLQKDLDAADRKATSLKQTAARAVGAKKKNADAAISEFDRRNATAKASLSKLSDDMSPAWDSMKKSAKDDVDAVNKAVESLDDTLNKK